MSHEIAILREDLVQKCKRLSILNEKPQLHIVDYFYSIRNEIDYEIEKSLEESANKINGFDYNSTRTKLIEELVRQEKIMLEKPMNDANKLASTQKYNTFERQIEEIFSKTNEEQLSLSDFEDHYEKIVLQLLDEKRELERAIISNQTFIYAPSEDHKDGGCLVHIEGHFLDSDEIECFKKFSKNTEFPNGHLLSCYNEFLEKKRNEKLCFGIKMPCVINKNMFTISFLTRLLKQRTPDDGLLLLHLDENAPNNHFSSFESEENPYESYDEMLLDRQSFESFEDSNSLDYFTSRIQNLNLSRNRLKDIKISSDFASRLVNINFSENRVTSFDKKMFESLKNVEKLKMENTFIPGLDFNADFLFNLTSLKCLHFTIPISFDFKLLTNMKNIEKIRINVVTPTTLEKQELQRMTEKALEILSSRLMLRMLYLSGFDTGSNDPFKLLKSSNLTQLTLKCNEISRIEANTFNSFAKANRLDRLDLSDNNITSLPKGVFDSLSSLQYLDLSNNKLTSVQAGVFNKMRRLLFLILANNPIESIEESSFAGEATLYDLDLSGCKLKSIDNHMFKDTNIRHKLMLSRNLIESFEFKDEKNKIKLNKQSYTNEEKEMIKANMFTRFDQLECLELDDNQMEELDLICFCNLNSLNELDLSGNKLRSLSNATPDALLMNLSSLNLADNRLQNLADNFFSSLRNLKLLYLQNNPLKFTMNEGTFNSELTVLNFHNTESINFQAWDQLKYLSGFHLEANHSQFSAFFKDNAKLEYLGVSKSNPVMIESFFKSQTTNLRQLVYFDFSNNSLTTLDGISLGKSCPQIKRIILAKNNMSGLKPSWFEGLVRLEALDISENLIETLDDPKLFSAFKQSLKRLSIRSNKLSHVHRRLFRGMINLEVLDLGNNQLQSVDDGLLRDLFKLQKFSLSGNNIAFLNVNRFFNKNHQLKLIDFSNNQLDDHSINESTFKDLELRYELTELYLKNNKLKNIDFLHHFPKLRDSYFNGIENPSTADDSTNRSKSISLTKFMSSHHILNHQKSVHLYAGPIWSNDHAQKICPEIAYESNKIWRGHWTTIVMGSASVCFCHDE